MAQTMHISKTLVNFQELKELHTQSKVSHCSLLADIYWFLSFQPYPDFPVKFLKILYLALS